MQCHWARQLEQALPPAFYPLALSLPLILQGRLYHTRGDNLASQVSLTCSISTSVTDGRGRSSNPGRVSQSPCSFQQSCHPEF